MIPKWGMRCFYPRLTWASQTGAYPRRFSWGCIRWRIRMRNGGTVDVILGSALAFIQDGGVSCQGIMASWHPLEAIRASFGLLIHHPPYLDVSGCHPTFVSKAVGQTHPTMP